MAEKPSHGFRRTPPINPVTANAFVELDAAVAAPPAPVVVPVPAAVEPPAAKPEPAAVRPAARTRRKTLVRADGRELRKQTIYFETETSTRLAVYCAQTGKDISEVVGLAVMQFLARTSTR